ncbi:signaling threshold-regulating transmembrane adapter 1-like [Lampris incognitus]|uniref:signaling threshold-regulating transmembrane adapter 1-like n=1 Tax=Lampris incognitus TaxID=2546036 RepID=UPI0024B6190A|nr:signaling threshold-regulating transmembrane adapter 1-like [Lampris incognitus]
MEKECNGTKISVVLRVFCGSLELWMLLGVVSTLMVLSLCWNILWYMARVCPEKGKAILPTFRRSLRPVDMEDNPIYGNITYKKTNSPYGSSSLREHNRVRRGSEPLSKDQDCYANLELKPPKQPSGRASPSPAIQYSDVATLLEYVEPDKDRADNADTVSTLSDLYAAVQTQRPKTLDTTDNGKGYANHI